MPSAEYMREYRRKRRSRALSMLGGRCVRCGATESLEFDHVDPTTKSFNLGTWTRAWSDILEELKKCQLLCTDCHQDKSDEEQKGTDAPHGTMRRYRTLGCRCSPCVEAKRRYHREWKRKKARERDPSGKGSAL